MSEEITLMSEYLPDNVFHFENSYFAPCFIERERELKDREVKIKREIEELFFKSIIVSIDDMDKFELKEMKKIRSIKNTWYDWLINYIPEPIRKSVGGFKDNFKDGFKVFLRQTHLNKPFMGEERN